MGSSQQFSLRWNNYLKHITCAFDTLRTDEDLVDVTLSCEGKRIRAHKMLLSACSTYFRDLFKENPCQHPVIIFRNVKFDDLAALVDFMYQGEVNVVQEQLASFLTTAELLAVQGLTDGTGKDDSLVEDDLEIPNEPEVQLQNTSGKSTGDNKRNKSPSSPMPYHAVELQPEVPPNKRRKIRESTNVNAEKNSAGINAKDCDGKTSENQTGPASDPVEIIPLMPNLKLEMPEYLEQDGSSCSYEDQSIGDSTLNKITIDDTSSTTPDHEQKPDISQTFYSSQSTSDGLDGKHQSDVGHLLSKPSTSGERATQDAVQDKVTDVVFEEGNSGMGELLTEIPHTGGIVSDNFKEAPCVMDVRGWVKKRDEENVREEPLLSILDSGMVKPTHRQELVRLAVSEMSQLHNNTLYPTAQIKEQLAKDIISAFPKLRSMLTIGGYEHFYDRKTNNGFIEFRLKTLRLKLSYKDKKRAVYKCARGTGKQKKLIKSVENESLLDEKNFKLKVSELALKMPNDTNKELILKLTDETRANRLNEIKNSDKPMTVAAILKKYPRFKDFSGELISKEFSAVFPENDIFLGTFCAFYAPRILQYCREVKPHLLQLVKDLEDDNVKALVLLPELLPSPNYTKRRDTSDKTSSSKTSQKRKVVPTDFSKKVVPNQNLLQFIHASNDLSLHLALANRGTRNVQPFLVCSKRGQERRGIYYIMTDGHLIQIGDNAIIAFDILLKLHCCFDVEFAPDLVNFYDFITACVMKLHKPKGCSIALETTLQNVTLKENDESDNEIEMQDDEIEDNN